MVPQAAIRNFVENILDMKFFLLHPVFLFCDDGAQDTKKDETLQERWYKKNEYPVYFADLKIFEYFAKKQKNKLSFFFLVKRLIYCIFAAD